MVRKIVVTLCVYLISTSSISAFIPWDAIEVGAKEFFNPVVRVCTTKGGSTGTLMHVDDNPFFLATKHAVAPREKLWVEYGDRRISIRGVQALNRDVSLLFPDDKVPDALLRSAISVNAIQTVFSDIEKGLIWQDGSLIRSDYATLSGFPVLEGFGAGFGSPVIDWKGPFGLLGSYVKSPKSAFAFSLDGIYSNTFRRRPLGLEYDFNEPHTLYYKGNPYEGYLNRPASPGFSGSMVFNINNQPIGIVARILMGMGSQHLARPNGRLLNHLRRLFGHQCLPWIPGHIRKVPLYNRFVHKDMYTVVVPLFPDKKDISLRALLYYDSL